MTLKSHNTRIFGLDIIRTFAILLVVFGHGEFLLDNSILEGFPFFKMIDGIGCVLWNHQRGHYSI